MSDRDCPVVRLADPRAKPLPLPRLRAARGAPELPDFALAARRLLRYHFRIREKYEPRLSTPNSCRDTRGWIFVPAPVWREPVSWVTRNLRLPKSRPARDAGVRWVLLF